MKSNPVSILVLILIGVYLYIFGILLNYENAWMHPETVNTTYSILSKHESTAERLWQGLNWDLAEAASGPEVKVCRPRLFSYIALAVNVVLRNGLFQWVPPHPSLSITWIFALILAPLFLYRLMINLTANKEAALIAAILYLSLPGSLIPIIMLFHPGKVFTNFFLIFCLYRASKIHKRISDPGYTQFKKDFLKLSLIIFLAFFFDEYALFIFPLIPLFFPTIFYGRFRKTAIPVYLCLPVLYLLSVTFFLPWLYASAGFPGFNFFNNMGGLKTIPFPDLANVFTNFILLLHDNLLAGFNAYLKDNTVGVSITRYWSPSNQLVHADNIRYGLSVLNDKNPDVFTVLHNILFLGVTSLFLLALRKSPQDPTAKGYVLKSFLALVLFTFFFSLLHISNYILSGCAWYGCSFSVLFALFGGLALHQILRTSRLAKILTILFLISLTAHSLNNTKILNTTWMLINRKPSIQLDVWLNRIDRKDLYQDYQAQKKKANFEMTYSAWKNRHDREKAAEFLKRASLETRYYLYRELPYIR